MLTGIQVVLIGGDARQLEVIQAFSDMDASVTLIGFNNLQNQYSGVIKAELTDDVFRQVDALILPPVGTDDHGRVNSIFSAAEYRLGDEQMSQLPSHAKVYTGMAKPYLKELCAKHQLTLIELFDRDDVAIYNSIPTAEGAVMMAIQNTDITLHGAKCIVLGMGRTGFTLARTLQGMGAFVKIGVRRDDHFARAMEMGFQPFITKDWSSQASDVDLLFNTIPSMIVTAQVIANMPPRAVIIDLSSKPGGIDFRFAEKRGIKAMLAPGLPGIVAPKTAGQIIAKSLIQLILDDARERGNDHELEG